MICPNCQKDLSEAQWMDSTPPTAEELADPGYVGLVVCAFCCVVCVRDGAGNLRGMSPDIIAQIPAPLMEAIRRRQRWLFLKKAEAN